MSLRKGQLLKDATSGEERFRIGELLSDGRNFYIAGGEDTHLESMLVALKCIKYSDNPGEQEAQERVDALRLELEVLTQPSTLFPEPIDWVEVESDLGGLKTEPVLVLEHIAGKTLREEINRGAMLPARALIIVHEIALALADLHDAGFVFRDLDPDHVLIGFDDVLHLVGTGNVARAKSRPIPAKMQLSARYSAPEIRGERSGKFITKRADVYALGALLSFLLTGEEPTREVEGPLSTTAHGKLLALPQGFALLVARSLQPMAKNRFPSARAMLPFLSQSGLPSRSSPGFKTATLPLPFDRNVPDNRATRSKISAGPLMSQPNAGATLTRKETPWWKGCLPWVACVLGTVGAALYQLF
jgi:serine/threonine protein kinase